MNSIACFAMARNAFIWAMPPAIPCSANSPSFIFSIGSSSSNRRAVAIPSEAAASPVAQTSTRRCRQSSFCCSPSSKRGVPGLTLAAPRKRLRWYRMTGSTAESSLAAVMTPTVTRVRRKTASMISPWLNRGMITPSFTV